MAKKKTNSVNDVVKVMAQTKERLGSELKGLKEEINHYQEQLEVKIQEVQKLDAMMNEIQGMSIASGQQSTMKTTNKPKGRRKKSATVSSKDIQQDLQQYKQNTIIGTMIEMLKDRPMHYKELIENLREVGFPMDGKRPEATMVALLSRDQRFERVQRGVYQVNKKAI